MGQEIRQFRACVTIQAILVIERESKLSYRRLWPSVRHGPSLHDAANKRERPRDVMLIVPMIKGPIFKFCAEKMKY